ncbi:MAG: prenyltransferase/squalene oxidase repeat-containing protein [Pirellulales bacterium]
MNYLAELTVRLAAGLGNLPESDRARHVRYLRAAQQPDGGFAGREGGSDLYYTSFGLRGLAVLGELHGDAAQRAASFLRGRLSGRESIVDFLSLIYSARLLADAAGCDPMADAAPAWRDAVAQSLAQLRRPDGGYAKGPEGHASSTYHTFLVVLCLQLIEREVPAPEQVVAFIRSQSCHDGGGFREIRAGKRAGTNPTAAAVGTLRALNALTADDRESTLDFLVEMQNDEGGLRANTRIPIADLLSTFTGLVTLIDLQGLPEIDVAAALRFVRGLEMTTGGFHGASWDPAHDVEYTFYGLGCRALLAGVA